MPPQYTAALNDAEKQRLSTIYADLVAKGESPNAAMKQLLHDLAMWTKIVHSVEIEEQIEYEEAVAAAVAAEQENRASVPAEEESGYHNGLTTSTDGAMGSSPDTLVGIASPEFFAQKLDEIGVVAKSLSSETINKL